MAEYITPKLYPVTKVPPLNLKPYDFSNHYFSEMLSRYPEDVERYQHFIKLLSVANVVEIDDRLVSLIEGTDNKTFYRPLFFKYIFINTDLKVLLPADIDKLWWVYIIKGMGLIDLGDDWAILVLAIDPQNQRLIKQTMWLLKESEPFFTDKKMLSDNAQLRKHIRMIACNIIDLVECNDADLEVVTIKPTAEQQEKRQLRNKSILPTKVFIRPKTHFIRYIQEYNKPTNLRLPPRYLVRGHWRHYRDEKYSVKLRQKPQWIKPFYKGMGFIKQNVYKVIP